MAVNKYIYQLIVGCLMLLSNSLVSTEYVPVFIWESSKSNEIVPALPRINQETFKEIIQEKLDKKSLVVIFAEPNLSSEDFGELDSAGNKVFSHLANMKAKTTYLPSVDDPIDVLKNIYNNVVTQTTSKSFNSEDINTPLLIVDLDDVQDNETRNDILQRHDKNIYNIYNILEKEKGDVFAIFTAYHTSWIIPEEIDLSRQARSVLTTRAEGDPQLFSTDDFLLYVSSSPDLSLRGTTTDLSTHNTTSSFENSVLNATISKEGETGLEMLFRFSGGYWILSNVTIVDTNYNRFSLRVTDIAAPEAFSYQCTNQVFSQRNDSTTSVSLPGMQVQPFRVATSRFGDPYYCIGFTTAPIWSGIFVTAILVTIMAIGLSMMMDIRTMDRFDDPKGKTIQINVSE